MRPLSAENHDDAFSSFADLGGVAGHRRHRTRQLPNRRPDEAR